MKIPDMIDSDIAFSFGNNSYNLPTLVVKPPCSLGKKCSFFLRVVPESNIYSLHKFSPITNNINCQWYFNNSVENGKLLKCMYLLKNKFNLIFLKIADSKSYVTPYYNSLILQDLVMDENEILLKEIVDSNQNVQDALILLKIWLTQKNLDVSGKFIHN